MNAKTVRLLSFFGKTAGLVSQRHSEPFGDIFDAGQLNEALKT